MTRIRLARSDTCLLLWAVHGPIIRIVATNNVGRLWRPVCSMCRSSLGDRNPQIQMAIVCKPIDKVDIVVYHMRPTKKMLLFTSWPNHPGGWTSHSTYYYSCQKCPMLTLQCRSTSTFPRILEILKESTMCYLKSADENTSEKIEEKTLRQNL